MLKLAALLSLVGLPYVQATSPLFGQCGGTGWTGDTTCVAGSTCIFSNPFYSQCLPASTTGGSTSAPGTTSIPTSTPLSSSSKSSTPTTTSSVTGSTAVPTPAAGNPYTGYTVYLSPNYANEINAAAAIISDPTQHAKALSVANIPTFIWFDTINKTSQLGIYLADADSKAKASGQKYLVQIVVYDLPDRDCAAFASNGEFSIANNGLNNYMTYIDQLVVEIKQYPNVRVVAVIEPDSLANLVTNLNVAKCANAESAYKAGITYAMQKLNALGVYMYLDAGHAGWLGWPANLAPAATLFSQMFSGAGSPQFVRGLATNVANYNALVASTPDPITSGNSNYDELLYISALTGPLASAGFPAHFIVDQGRSGVQNIRSQWGDWCNVKGAGFGVRPTLNTPNTTLIDSIVWVKPGGECDGTSNTSSPRYDAHCSNSDAAQPAPEAGTWFQAYFQTLVSSANPPL